MSPGPRRAAGAEEATEVAVAAEGAATEAVAGAVVTEAVAVAATAIEMAAIAASEAAVAATEVVGAAGVAEVSVAETDTEEEVAGAAGVAGDTVWIIYFSRYLKAIQIDIQFLQEAAAVAADMVVEVVTTETVDTKTGGRDF